MQIYADMVKPAFVFDGRNILDHAKLREVRGVVWAGAWACGAERRRGSPADELATARALHDVFHARALHRLPAWGSPQPPTPHPHNNPLPDSDHPQIGFIVYALGKPLDPFLQRAYD